MFCTEHVQYPALMEADYHDVEDEPFCTTRLLIGSHALWFCIIAFHIFLAITSMLGNTVILVALNKESSLHPPSKILLRSLAFTDFCVGMLLEPLFVIFLMTVVNKSLNLCREIVVLTLFAGQVLCCVSLFTLTAISVDRLLALLLGMRYRQTVTSKRVLLSVVSLWSLSIGFATVVFWNKKITACYVAIVVLLCIIVSTCCYIQIFQKLIHHQAQIQEHVHQGQPNGHEPLNIARYRKTVSSALWVQLSLLACYLPMVLTSVSVAVEGLTSSVFVAWTLSSTLVFFNSTLNPVLYCWKIREVRSSAMNTLRQIWCCL